MTTKSFVQDHDEGEFSPHAFVFDALTDFSRTHVISVEPDSTLCDALQDMEQRQIHALLVTQQAPGGIEQRVLGLITYRDIERWRLSRIAHQPASETLRSARVGNVMTPWSKLPLLRYESLQVLTPAELYSMFQHTAKTHFIVVEQYGEGPALARGLISGEILAQRMKLSVDFAHH